MVSPKTNSLALLILSLVFGLVLPTAAAAAPTITSLSITSGIVGAQVTITGTGFGSAQGSSTVQFNGMTATASTWTDTSITVAVPSGATSGNVIVNVGGVNSNGESFTVTQIPTGWTDADVGTAGVAGSATYARGTYTVKGAGQGISGTSDGFNFAYQPLSGDGTIIARVVSLQGNNLPVAGVMIRETLTAGSAHGFTDFSLDYGAFYFSYRATTSGSSANTGASYVSAPYWVKLVRSGSTFTSFVAMDGVNWAQSGTTQTISMAQNVYVGLAVTNSSTSALATATFDSVSVSSTSAPAPVITSVSATTGAVGSQVTIKGTGFGAAQGGSLVTLNDASATINSWAATSIVITIPTGATSGPLLVSVAPSMNDSNSIDFTVTSQPLLTPWLDQDVGSVAIAGAASYASRTYTVSGSGHGITGTGDGFHFVYQPLSGDGTVIARVVSLQGNNSPTAGVMIRATLDPGSTFVYTDYSLSYVASYFLYRSTTGSTVTSGASSSVPSLPYWVKLVR